jgi:glycosidase
MTTTIYQLVSTGNYDEKAITKFYAKQVKLNNGNIDLAEAMVRIYKHNFLIRTKKAF